MIKRNGVRLAAIALSLICVATILLLENITLQAGVLAVWVVAIGMLYRTAGILHPLSWFPPFFLAYSISYPLFVAYYGYVDELLPKLIPVSAIALMGFVVGTCFVCSRVNLRSFPAAQTDRLEWRLHKPLLVWCMIVLALVFLSGAGTKREVLNYLDANPLIRLALNGFSFLIIVSLSIVLWSASPVRFALLFGNPAIALTAVVLFIAFGILGERDLLFKFLLSCFLIVHSRNHSTRGLHMIALVLVAFLILPVTQAAKSFVLSGDLSTASVAMEELLGSEFSSAARNLHYILGTQFTELNGATYIWDLQRFFGFLFPDAESATSWFNNVVRDQYGEGGTAGWGFSLVAEAYINFGLTGVFLQFLLIGIVSSKVYTLCRRGIYYSLFYLLYIPTVIYCLRADMANYLSLNIKQNLVMVLFLAIGATVYRSRIKNRHYALVAPK